MKCLRVLLAVPVCLLLAHAGPACAQWNPSATAYMGQLMGPLNLEIGNLSFGRLMMESYTHPDGSQTPKAPQASLSFVRSPAVAAEFKSNLLAALVKQNPAEEEKLRSELGRIDVDDVFAKALRGQGLSATNLADVLAANVALCWKIVNAAPDPSPAAMHAVAAQLTANLSGKPAFARSSDRDKQLMAEALAYQTVFAASAATSAQAPAAPNAAALASLRQQLMTRFRTMNVDLTALRLTDTGFAPK